jgi:hypothetical protein
MQPFIHITLISPVQSKIQNIHYINMKPQLHDTGFAC